MEEKGILLDDATRTVLPAVEQPWFEGVKRGPGGPVTPGWDLDQGSSGAITSIIWPSSVERALLIRGRTRALRSPAR